MKNLKICVLFLFCLTVSTKPFAQTFEVKAGMNWATMLSKDDIETYSDKYQMVPRLLLGATAEFPLTGLFSFETGLLLASNNYSYGLANISQVSSVRSENRIVGLTLGYKFSF